MFYVDLRYFLVGFLICVFLVADLRDGELVCGQNFNLFAAMSALEVTLAIPITTS